MKFKESGKVELKKSTAELKEALNDLCAFANSGIGTIYFGISDKGKVVGQDISDSTLKKVSTTILSLIEPRLYPNVYIERWGTGIKKMNRLMKEYELNIPDYEEVSGNFLVTFKKKEISVEKRLETEPVPSLSQVCPK